MRVVRRTRLRHPADMDLDAIDQGGLEALGALELRALVGQLIERAQTDRADIVRRDAHIARLTAEIATLKRRPCKTPRPA